MNKAEKKATLAAFISRYNELKQFRDYIASREGTHNFITLSVVGAGRECPLLEISPKDLGVHIESRMAVVRLILSDIYDVKVE